MRLLAFGIAMPSTLFLGSGGLEAILNGRAELGVGFIIIMAAFLKILATTTALTAGFIGGPIFPLCFVGSAIGVVIWQIFPVIPLSMAVGCLMAAVPTAVVPLPLTLGVIVLLTLSRMQFLS